MAAAAAGGYVSPRRSEESFAYGAKTAIRLEMQTLHEGAKVVIGDAADEDAEADAVVVIAVELVVPGIGVPGARRNSRGLKVTFARVLLRNLQDAV